MWLTIILIRSCCIRAWRICEYTTVNRRPDTGSTSWETQVVLRMKPAWRSSWIPFWHVYSGSVSCCAQHVAWIISRISPWTQLRDWIETPLHKSRLPRDYTVLQARLACGSTQQNLRLSEFSLLTAVPTVSSVARADDCTDESSTVAEKYASKDCFSASLKTQPRG